jgi:hypothetical protein
MDDALAFVTSAPSKNNNDLPPSPDFEMNCLFRRPNWYELQHITQLDGMKKSCQVCVFETSRRKSLDGVVCDTHHVKFCNGKPHQDVRWYGMKQADGTTPVTDFSWAAPDPIINCWDTFHQLYLPHFVKPKERQPFFDKDNFHFCHIAVWSDLKEKKFNHWGKWWKSEDE